MEATSDLHLERTVDQSKLCDNVQMIDPVMLHIAPAHKVLGAYIPDKQWNLPISRKKIGRAAVDRSLAAHRIVNLLVGLFDIRTKLGGGVSLEMPLGVPPWENSGVAAQFGKVGRPANGWFSQKLIFRYHELRLVYLHFRKL